MLAIGAVMTIVLSFLVVMAVVVPKIRRKRKAVNKPPLSLPAPDTSYEKEKMKIRNQFILSGRNWCEFYKSLKVKGSSRIALAKYYPHEPPDPRHKKFKNEQEFLRARAIYNFINNKKEEGENVECRMKKQ